MTGRVTAWLRRRHRAVLADADRGGFAALELTIMVTFVIVMLLVIAAAGRVSHGRQLVDQAAQAAARAGSLSLTPGDAQVAAEQAATQTLADGGLSCGSMRVSLDTSRWYAGGDVVAQLSCNADLSALTTAGVPGTVTLNASSTSPLESYRQLSGSGS